MTLYPYLPDFDSKLRKSMLGQPGFFNEAASHCLCQFYQFSELFFFKNLMRNLFHLDIVIVLKILSLFVTRFTVGPLIFVFFKQVLFSLCLFCIIMVPRCIRYIICALKGTPLQARKMHFKPDWTVNSAFCTFSHLSACHCMYKIYCIVTYCMFYISYIYINWIRRGVR